MPRILIRNTGIGLQHAQNPNLKYWHKPPACPEFSHVVYDNYAMMSGLAIPSYQSMPDNHKQIKKCRAALRDSCPFLMILSAFRFVQSAFFWCFRSARKRQTKGRRQLDLGLAVCLFSASLTYGFPIISVDLFVNS